MDDNLQQRVTALESDVKVIAQSVSALSVDVKNLVNHLERQSNAIDHINNRMGLSAKTNWSVIASWTAVLVTVFGGLGYLTVNPLQEYNYKQDRLNHHITEKLFQLSDRIYESRLKSCEK